MQYQNRYVRVTIDEYNLLRDFKQYIDSGLTVEVGEDNKHEISFLRTEGYIKIYTTEDAVKKLQKVVKTERDRHEKQEKLHFDELKLCSKNESEHFKSMSLWDFFIWKWINRRKAKDK